jgi:hypothetical protein
MNGDRCRGRRNQKKKKKTRNRKAKVEGKKYEERKQSNEEGRSTASTKPRSEDK